MFRIKSTQVICFIFAVIILSTLLFLILYKSFCTLNQVVDWVAVSSIVDIIVLIFTGAAIYIAIAVPRRDRLEASRINLFSYRYECLDYLQNALKSNFQTHAKKFDEADFYNKLGKLVFLIQQEDFTKLEGIVKTIIKKTEKKFKEPDKPNLSISIDQDIIELYKIFENYLDLRVIGFEFKNNSY